MKSVIIGFATNMSISEVSVFLRSARSVHQSSEVDIVIITNNAAPLMEIAKETNAELVKTNSTFGCHLSRTERYTRRIIIETLRLLSRGKINKFSAEFSDGYFSLMEVWQHPHIIRWNAYLNFLRFRSNYKYVALCDVKDVVFQSSAFEKVPHGVVLIGEDSTPMTGNDTNSKWIIEAFGRDVWSKMTGKNPLCVGVIIGSTDIVLKMVEEFHSKFFDAPFGKIEQALFNKMYFEGSFTVRIQAVPNRERIATLGGDWVNDLVTSCGGLIIDSRSLKPYPIVHMYDRFPHLRDIVQAKFL